MRRYSLFPAISFAIILLTGAIIMLTGCSNRGEDDIVLATVGDSTITYALLDEAYTQNNRDANLPPDAEYERKKLILDNMVEIQMLANAAEEAGLAEDSAFAERLEIEKRNAAAAIMHEDRIDSKRFYSEEEIPALLEDAENEIDLTVLQVYHPADSAENAYRRLMNGATVDELIDHYSYFGQLKNNRGEMGFRPVTFYTSAMRKVVDTLSIGEFSKPFYANDSYWIVKVNARKELKKSEDSPNYDEIVANAQDSRFADLMDDMYENIFEQYPVQIDTGMIKTYENRINMLGKAKGHYLDFEMEYFTDEEFADTIAAYEGGALTFREFIEGFKWVPPPNFPKEGDMDSYKRFMQKCLLRELPGFEAVRQGYDEDPRYDVLWRLNYMKLMADRAIARIAFEGIEITDEEVRTEYDENNDKYYELGSADVDEIFVQSEETAKEVLRKLKAGASFSRMVQEYSKRTYSKQRGGRIGEVSLRRMPYYYNAVKENGIGKYLGPIPVMNAGFGIIKARSYKKAKPKSFETVERDIKRQLLDTKRRAARDSFIVELEQKYVVDKDYKKLQELVGFNPQP